MRNAWLVLPSVTYILQNQKSRIDSLTSHFAEFNTHRSWKFTIWFKITVRCALFGIEEKDRCPNWKGGVYDPCQVSENAGKETSNEQKWNKLLHYDNVYSVFGLLLLTGYSSSFFERDDWWLHNKYNIPSLKAVVTMRECTSCERPNNVRFLWCSAFCNESIFGKNWHITVGLSLTDWTVIKVK